MNNSQTVIQKDFYVYTVSALALASSGSATDSIKVETDANFVWVKSCYFADIAAAAQTENTRVIPLVNVSILDSGSGRNLQSNPVPLTSIAGRGELPFVLPVPRLFRANATIAVTFTNFDAAATYNIRMAFIGYKQFKYAA